jgi:hypothetical protein
LSSGFFSSTSAIAIDRTSQNAISNISTATDWIPNGFISGDSMIFGGNHTINAIGLGSFNVSYVDSGAIAAGTIFIKNSNLYIGGITGNPIVELKMDTGGSATFATLDASPFANIYSGLNIVDFNGIIGSTLTLSNNVPITLLTSFLSTGGDAGKIIINNNSIVTFTGSLSNTPGTLLEGMTINSGAKGRFQFDTTIINIEGQGNFILKFRDFCILTESKIYTNNVNCKAREQLKQELITNDRCFFGWLVSMDTDIDRFDKSSFMFEWLSGNKCVTYINSLATHEEPIELLRSIYFTCHTIYTITNVDATEISELHKLKENEIKIKEITQKMLQNSIERDEIVLKLKENFSRNDEMIRQILNKETNKIVDKKFGRILDWWNFHIMNDEGYTMRSSNIWTMFKRDNPDLIGEIQANDFKDMIYTFISEDRIVKPRNKFGALEIKNIRWKIDRGNAES